MNGGEERAAVSSGVVTFLFTDIEGSTRRWEADAEVMRAALETHDQVLRDAVEVHKGRMFKHTGDGVCAVFASPRAAVDAAVAAQRALELPVRIGIATGEAELRGGDYFGAVLNRAARVMACGHGGQILLDGPTAALLSGVDLVDLGPRRLRDIANAVNMFQVRASGLRTEFPPLKTLDATLGNLRPPTTSLIGRDEELVGVQAALRAHRLVTLTGVGGVGKTRLASQVAARMTPSFPDGVWMIELAAVGDPGAVPEAVAAVLGIIQQPGMSVADSVAAALEGRSRLLVFDNCEHVLDAAADMIEAILAHSATVRILATSREGLRLGDEQLWPVPSLAVHTVDSAAAKLFVERAGAVAPGISLHGADEAGAVVEICRRLDGLPLGIELAASRMQSMTVTEIRDRLDDRFRLLIGSRRGLQRHQTLRHAVQWSYDLLDDAEKTLLARCSVFAGGFDIAGACAVAGSSDEFATLDLLDTLVRKSLVVPDPSSGQTRFSMLETIRQFADEQLVTSGDADETRTAHARYFAARETDILALWDSPRQGEAHVWITVELANLRTAFRWAVDHGDLDTAATIAVYTTLLGFWIEQHEPIGWAEELIERARAVDHRRRAQLYVMAAECYRAGRIDEAVGYAEGARLAIDSGRFDQVPHEAEAWLGGAYITTGQPERWVELCRNIIARTPGTLTYTRAALVFALTIAGAYDEAVAASEGLLSAADAADNPGLASWALLGYGFACRDVDPAIAYDVFRRSLAIARESGNRWVESHLALSLGRLAATHGDAMDAFDYLTLAIRNNYDSGSFSILPTALAVLATFLDRLGHHEPAATISGFAATPLARAAFPEINAAIAHLREVLGDEGYESFARAGKNMTNAAMATYAFDQIDRARAQFPGDVALAKTALMAQTALARGDVMTARRLADDAVNAATGWYRVVALTTRARVAIAQGESGQAERDTHAALACAAESHMYQGLSDAVETLAGLAGEAGSHHEAARLFGAAEAIRERTAEVRLKIYQAGYDAAVAALRNAMGDTDFDAAWAEGAALSIEEAIAYAQRGRGERKRPAKGWGSLTPTERDVVRLVSEGLTNKDIATRLFISPRTVETHLTHVYTKLGLTSRVQLVQEAARHT